MGIVVFAAVRSVHFSRIIFKYKSCFLVSGSPLNVFLSRKNSLFVHSTAYIFFFSQITSAAWLVHSSIPCLPAIHEELYWPMFCTGYCTQRKHSKMNPIESVGIRSWFNYCANPFQILSFSITPIEHSCPNKTQKKHTFSPSCTVIQVKIVYH